jgi:hypothetical protein
MDKEEKKAHKGWSLAWTGNDIIEEPLLQIAENFTRAGMNWEILARDVQWYSMIFYCHLMVLLSMFTNVLLFIVWWIEKKGFSI